MSCIRGKFVPPTMITRQEIKSLFFSPIGHHPSEKGLRTTLLRLESSFIHLGLSGFRNCEVIDQINLAGQQLTRSQTTSTTIKAGKACNMSGILQLQSLLSLEVARHMPAAGIAPPFHPLRQTFSDLGQSERLSLTCYTVQLNALFERNISKM